MNYLQFFCMEDLFNLPPFIDSIVYFCQYGLMDNYFKLRVIMQNCFIYFFVQIVPGLFCIFSALALHLAISPRLPGSFYWRIVLETKIWALSLLVAARPSQLAEQGNICL